MIDYEKVAGELISGDVPACSSVLTKRAVETFLHDTLRVLFPLLEGAQRKDLTGLSEELQSIHLRLSELISLSARLEQRLDASDYAAEFVHNLPAIQKLLRLDAETLCAGDPAATSVEEVLLAYPGFFATATYRIAHQFYKKDFRVFPRMLTEFAHQLTGIDIHPGAEIGESFFIDHGTGVVIGETTTIGNCVKLYQGVTLGALSVDKLLSKEKRHPTIQDHVVIYSNATILGGKTVVGHHSVIGGNVWLTESVAPYSTVYHQSEVKVRGVKDPSQA